MDNKPLQTLTAYKYILKDAETKEIIDINNLDGGKKFITILREFADEILEIRTHDKVKKAIKLDSVRVEEAEETYIHFKVSSGQYGQKIIARDISNSANIKNIGTNEAACKNYNVIFYTGEDKPENLCIFHRWGTGGCKTAFLYFLKKFLDERNLKIEMYPIVAPGNMNELLNSKKTMLKLRQYSQKESVSTDVSENVAPKKTANNIEAEVTVHLKNNYMKQRLPDSIINKIIKKEEKVQTYYQLPEGFDDYETIVFAQVGRRTKQFNINELGSMLCQYDITEKLQFDEDNEPIEENLMQEFHSYYQLQIQKMGG